MIIFPNLAWVMKQRRVTQKKIADALDISETSVMHKLHGKVEFTLAEAFAIRDMFPGNRIENLFYRHVPDDEEEQGET